MGAVILTGLLGLTCAAACGSSGGAPAGPTGGPTATQSSPADTGSPSGAAAQAVSSAKWKEAFNADFDGTALDTKIWRVGEPWQQEPPGFEEGPDAFCPVPQGPQVTVADGALRLMATADPKAKNKVLSCGVSTRGTFSMTHGYIEARVKLPTGAGLWPSFWLLGNGTGADGWPKTGEVDIFEFVNNGSADGIPFVTLHWGGDCPDGHCSITRLDSGLKAVKDYGSRWMTVGLLRTADSLTVYVDGVAQPSMRRGDRNPQGSPIGDVIFDSPMHVKLDLSAGGWATNPDVATQPGEYLIDYVRVWS